MGHKSTPKSVVFLMRRYWLRGLSVRECAEHVGCSIGLVAKHYARWNAEIGEGGNGGIAHRRNSRRVRGANYWGAFESADLCELIAAPKSRRQLRYWTGGDE